MLRNVAFLLLWAAAASACATVETVAGNVPAAGRMGGTAAATLPTSGGTTIGAAQGVRKGETVEGVVQEGEPRYYRLELARGEQATATLYTRIARTDPYSGPSQMTAVAFLDENGGVLARDVTLTRETIARGGFDRLELGYTASRAGAVLVRVACEECGQRVHYRLALR